MVKVGGYILGEFGNLIAGDPRSSPQVQFDLLHSKYHLCSLPTRCLLLSTYLKFANLFAELKVGIVQVLRHDNNIRNSDAELQQRAVEYAALIEVADSDMMAAVCEEMPPFPERESSILAKLKKKRQLQEGENGDGSPAKEPTKTPTAQVNSGPTKAERAAAAPVTAKASDDLLGLNSPGGTPSNAAASGPPSSQQLLDLFAGPTSGAATDAGPSGNANDDLLSKMVFKNSGIIYEDQRIQIGVKSEFHHADHIGKMELYYGNKLQAPLSGISTTVQNSKPAALLIQLRPLGTNEIPPKAQVVQTIDIKCVDEFGEPPVLNMALTSGGVPVAVNVKLPVFLNKWFEPTEMNAEVFFTRWKSLALQPDLEAQRIFEARYPMDPESTRQKLTGFGLQFLSGIDPNPDNFVAAGIVHAATSRVGCLLRLEPNRKANMYRLTMRTSNGAFTRSLCSLLDGHF